MAYLAVIGMGEWGWVLLAGLLLFGAKKIPELARSMGTSINAFKKGMKEGDEPSAGSSEGAKPDEPSAKPTEREK